MICAIIVIKCTCFSCSTNLVDYQNNDLIIAYYCGVDITKKLRGCYAFERFLNDFDNILFKVSAPRVCSLRGVAIIPSRTSMLAIAWYRWIRETRTIRQWQPAAISSVERVLPCIKTVRIPPEGNTVKSIVARSKAPRKIPPAPVKAYNNYSKQSLMISRSNDFYYCNILSVWLSICRQTKITYSEQFLFFIQVGYIFFVDFHRFK